MLTQEQIQLYRRSPGAFMREMVVLDSGLMKLESWQERALEQFFDGDGNPRYSLGVWCLGKDSGKSTFCAALVTWALFFHVDSPPDIGIFASDEQQAEIVGGMVKRILLANPELADECQIETRRVTVPATDARLRVLSHDAPGSHGESYSVCVIDELQGWSRRDLLDSILAQSSKRRYGGKQFVLIVTTVGGFQSICNDFIQQMLKGEDERAHVVYETGPAASWISEAVLKEQAARLPPSEFARLWRNEMPTGAQNALFTQAQIDSIFSNPPEPVPQGKKAPVVVSLDYGRTTDFSAACAVEYTGGEFLVRHVQHWEGSRESPVPVVQLELALAEMRQRFWVMKTYADPYGLQSLLDRQGNLVEQVNFTAPLKHQLAAGVFEAVSQGTLRCDDHEELRKELAGLSVEDNVAGWRWSHRLQRDDVVTALALACWGARKLGDHSVTPTVFILDVDSGNVIVPKGKREPGGTARGIVAAQYERMLGGRQK